MYIFTNYNIWKDFESIHMITERYEKEKKKTYNKVKIHELINFNKPLTQIKVSIIIPVCNVEKYLTQCLDSAVNQTLQDIEIICVNDGSTDSSLEILKSYASKDKRIKIIDKDNAGYGHVMNIGMDMAQGEYIGILESDDYILPEMYATLYQTAKENNLDFVKSDFYRFYGEGKKQVKEYNKIARKDENYNTVICPSENQETFKFVMNTWCGIYKTSFLRENIIRHNETPGASFQDNGFWFKANVYAKRTMYLSQAFYMNRRDNPNSSVYNPNKIYCANTEYKLIHDFLEEENIKDQFIDVFNYKKYHNYMFTLKRIAPKYRKEYLRTISQEYRQQEEDGELVSKYLSSNEWNNILWIIRDPDEYYYEVVKKSVKVSVILPIYNMEKYLEQCLDSLINQTLNKIEIICINDGSTDNSLEILQQYQAKDHRIKIINQENRGAAVSRNIGINIAEGEYLSFLDSDDFFDKNMLKEAYQKAKITNSDICIYESYLYDNNTHNKQKCTFAVRKNELPYKDVFNRKDIKSNIFKSIMGWAWDKLYKKSFILNNNLEFQDQRTTNDMYFVFTSLLKAGRITVLEKPLYYHRRNDSNSLSNTREKSWDCFYKALLEVRNELKNMGIYEDYEQDFINYALHSCLWNLNTLDYVTAEKLFYKLRDEWFEELDILNHDEYYFKDKHEYDEYNDIISAPLSVSDEYSAFKMYYWKTKYEENKNKSVMSIPVKINDYETLTVGQMKRELLEYRENKENYKQLRNVSNLQHSQDVLYEIRSSKSYKLARLISWIPRKIREKLK